MPRWDDGPLVGRAEELEQLLSSVDRAVSRRGAGVLVAGDAGIGKTRLLDELAQRSASRGLRVLVGHCVDLGEVGLPYLPFVDLLRPLLADPSLADVVAGFPALSGRLPGLPVRDDRDELPALDRPPAERALRTPVDDGRLQLFESVAGLLAEVAARTPLLLVLEDVHWADRSSRDLLRYLLARLADEPLALVASYRADDLHRRHQLRPLLAELVRLPGVERLDLAPLPDAAVGQLVRGLGRERGGVAQSTVDDVVARAEGNAFYAEELLAAGLAGETLPLLLTDVLLARVEQLSPGAQQVLKVAAVAGRQVRHELVAAVGELSPAGLEAALGEAVHAHLLVVSADGLYRFRHALLQEAVVADLLPGERVRLHGAVAAHLAENPGAGTAAERAHHARESNDLPGALSASLEAAEEARRVGAPAEELQHLEAVLSLWGVVPDAPDRAGRDHVRVLLDAAASARRGGEAHRAVALLRTALGVLGQEGDPEARARVHYTLAQALTRAGDDLAAWEHSAAAVALTAPEPPSATRTWAVAVHARTSFSLNRMADAEAAATEALAAADALGLDSAWADTALTVARVHARDESGEEQLLEALARARRSGDADVELRALYYLATGAYETGDLPDALARAEEALGRAAELGIEWSFYAAETRHAAVVARYAAGDWDGSLALADQLARIPEMAAHVRAAGLLVLVGRGDPAAPMRLAWALELTGRLDGHVLLLLATAGAEAELAAWAGEPAAAVDAAASAIRRIEQLWGPDRLAAVRLASIAVAAAADAATAARSAGDEVRVRHWLDTGRALVDEARAAVADHEEVVGPIGAEGVAWCARLEAEAARLENRDDPALWRDVVAQFTGRHVYEVARSRLRLAAALLAADDRDAATTELRQAHATAAALQAGPLRAVVVDLARRGRVELELPARRPADRGGVLTPREADVLSLLARGRTNRQVGAALYISEKTASVHVSNILAKLGVGSRTEAVAVAAQRGLLPEPREGGAGA